MILGIIDEYRGWLSTPTSRCLRLVFADCGTSCRSP